jgi:excinuclease ABC subunit C
MQEARDLETFVTNTEREALILEATLIKKHQPKFNRALKDDRKHAWIRVNLDAGFPVFEVTRDIEKDGAKYYGPYSSSKRLEKFLDTARKSIPIGMCSNPEKVKRECMDFHLNRCSGPCKGHISSRKLQFEKAADIRDRLNDVAIIMRRQQVVDLYGANRDVLGVSRTEQAALVEMLIVRNGRLIGHDHFYFEVDLDTTDADVLTIFVEQFYFILPNVPDEILLSVSIPRMKQFSVWLEETHGKSVKIHVPSDGKELELVEMANKNAYRSLRKILVIGESEEEIVDVGVKELKVALNLTKAPMHIEGFDIANIQGTDPTGSCVVFRNGIAENKYYRMFKIRVKESPDDYAMMQEVVYRRYKGVLERGHRLPDLILVDGGKGQLNVTVRALSELGLDYVPVAALAKKDEILFTRDNLDGVALDFDSAGLHLVQRIRDEAHRFAQRYHHKLREKRFSGSILEEAPGIGPKRRTALLNAFGSYQSVRQATVDELARVEGMTEKAATTLREWLDTEGLD